MEAADKLCDELFHWLENRKECAGKLEKLAQKLEDVPQGSNIAVGVGGAAATVASIFGAALALTRDQTKDKATPLEVAAVVGTLAGAAASAISTLVETIITSSAFKKAIKLIKEDEKVGTNIQKQLRDLKDRCGETLKARCGGAPLGTHADELDCEVTTLLMFALARRSNTPVSLDLLRDFNRATFFHHMTPGGLDPAEASDFIFQALGTVNFLVLGKEMVKNIELIGIKAAAKAGSEALVATGFGMSLYDLIVKSEEQVKGDRVTEASEFLWDSAREILEDQQELKGQLDEMQHCNVSLVKKQSKLPREIIQKLVQMKGIIENLGEYSLSMDENGQRIINYIKGTCTDNTVVSWLKGSPHQVEFVNLLRFFQKRLTDTEYLTSSGRGHIHIVFVAHGGIVDQFMPAGGLVPRPYIRDTILYSPWNCSIDADAACAIAQGFIEVRDREFYNERSMAYCRPIPLRNRWNSMRRSLHDIPEILLSPVTPKEERAWALFQQFWMNRVELEKRVIIPYLVPKCLVNAFGEIPLYMLIFVTSFLLMFYGKTATVHLAAGLGRGRGTPSSSEERERQERERQERERQERERQQRERPAWFRLEGVRQAWERLQSTSQQRVRKKWRAQYAYTSDGTWMSVKMDNRNVDLVLYRALRLLLNTNL